jgi:hypothetical protein
LGWADFENVPAPTHSEVLHSLTAVASPTSSEPDIYLFINYRAFHFSAKGLEETIRERVLAQKVEKFCGSKFLDTEVGKRQFEGRGASG